LTEPVNFGEFVYSDVEFRQYRRRRAERLLRTGVLFLLAYVAAWSAVSLARGDWATLALQGVSAAGAAVAWYSVSRGRLGVAGHAYFLIVIPVVVGLIALEGVSGPFRSMSHFHLLPLTLGAYLLFFEHSARAAGVCGRVPGDLRRRRTWPGDAGAPGAGLRPGGAADRALAAVLRTRCPGNFHRLDLF